MNVLKHLAEKPMRAAIAGAFCICAPVAILAPAAPAVAQNSADLDRAARAVRAITTMRADFVQTDRYGGAVQGVLTFKNPGRIRFEYEDSVNMLAVANGSRLVFIDYDVQQLESWPIGRTPLGALLDPDRDLARFGTLVPTTNPNVISVAIADPERPEFGEMTLIFLRKPSAPGGLELVSWVALDSQNVRTTVRLSNHRYGMDVPNSTFRYRDPRQTTRRPR